MPRILGRFTLGYDRAYASYLSDLFFHRRLQTKTPTFEQANIGVIKFSTFSKVYFPALFDVPDVLSSP